MKPYRGRRNKMANRENPAVGAPDCGDLQGLRPGAVLGTRPGGRGARGSGPRKGLRYPWEVTALVAGYLLVISFIRVPGFVAMAARISLLVLVAAVAADAAVAAARRMRERKSG